MSNSPEAETISDIDSFLANGGFAIIAVFFALAVGFGLSRLAPGDVSREAYTILPEPKKSGWRNLLGSDA